MKYRKKPIVIDAVQWNGKNIEQVLSFTRGIAQYETNHNILAIETLEGVLQASIGDYIIKGVKGEFYPCKPEIFEATYEEVFE